MSPPGCGRNEDARLILFLSAEGDDAGLLAELERDLPGAGGRVERPGLVAWDSGMLSDTSLCLARVRQTLPAAERIAATSVTAWARAIYERVWSRLPEAQPWRLHLTAYYGPPRVERIGARAWHTARRQGKVLPASSDSTVPAGAGEYRARLIRQAFREVLRERRRRLVKSWVEGSEPWKPEESLVQVLLTSPEEGWLSVAPSPLPFSARQLISPFPAGEVAPAVNQAAPSRAFGKLLEAEQRLGLAIRSGETCVDLGAAPGSWTYVALQRGAQVTAVDRSPLREDLMTHPGLTFVRGDAFSLVPAAPVDWLLCDVIAAPERTIALLLEWLNRGWMRRFVVTLKLRGPTDHPKIDRLKQHLPGLAEPWFLTHLCANKGEVCAFGVGRT